MSDAVATNKKAFRDYFVLERFECGLELRGSEVKSIRGGHINLNDSFAKVEDGQVYLYNTHISPYAQASYMNPDATRKRRLLLHKKEIVKLFLETSQKGLTLVPLKVYFNSRGLAKVELATAKGKKFYDHRQDLKKREIDHKIRQALKSSRRR